RLHHLSEGRSSAPARFSPTPPPPPAAALEASRPRQDRARCARSACSLRVCLLLLAARAVSRVHPVDSASSSRSASRSAARSASGARNVAACRSRERGPTSVFPVPPYPLPAGELEASAARLRQAWRARSAAKSGLLLPACYPRGIARGSRWRLSPTDQCLSAGRTYRGQRDALRHSCGLAWSSRRSSGASRKFAALAVALVTPPVSTAPAAFRFRGSLLTICSSVPRRGLPAAHNLRRCATRLLGSPGHAGPRRRCVALRRALANVGHHSVGPYAACLHSATVTSVWPISPQLVRF